MAARWTKEEVQILKQNYGKAAIQSFMHLLNNRSVKAIEKKANSMGLRSKKPGSPLYTGNPSSYRPTGKDHHAFREPGKAYAAAGRMFIKRTPDSQPESYARYQWVKKRGSIPKNHCIVHIDGDQLNCDINNLKCVSRSELVRMNHTSCKDPEMRRIRMRIAHRKISWVDAVLRGIV
jgi:hypothetical protein